MLGVLARCDYSATVFNAKSHGVRIRKEALKGISITCGISIWEAVPRGGSDSDESAEKRPFAVPVLPQKYGVFDASANAHLALLGNL